jgi:hypothetical protein
MGQKNERKAGNGLTDEARSLHKEREKSEKSQNVTREGQPIIPAAQARVYREALALMNDSGITYAVGAAFARYAYTNIWRQTKDLDVFLKPDDLRPMMDLLEANGFETEVKDRLWLAKAWKDGHFLDLIFGTGHGALPIDDRTFEGGNQDEVLQVMANLVPIEEMIASAMYIAGRNRFDGPEVAHLIRGSKGKLDWQRILNRLGDNRQLLLWHLVMFDFVYPGHHNYLPKDLMTELINEMHERWNKPARKPKAFRGTLLDPFSYTVDVEDWGYEDQRSNVPLVNKQGKAL